MFSFFRKKPVSEPIPLEAQLQTLAACGVTMAPGTTLEDVFNLYTRAELEAAPYKHLIPALGGDLEREPFSPLCHRLWICDHECIDDHGSYADVITRLHQLSGESLGISGITDCVDIDQKTAWVEFDVKGSRIHWTAEVDNDWLDATVITRFQHLLELHRSPFRLYAAMEDFGQAAFYAGFTSEELERFSKHAPFRFREMDQDA